MPCSSANSRMALAFSALLMSLFGAKCDGTIATRCASKGFSTPRRRNWPIARGAGTVEARHAPREPADRQVVGDGPTGKPTGQLGQHRAVDIVRDVPGDGPRPALQ